MKSERYLLDTHALIFWVEETLPRDFLRMLDSSAQNGHLFVSTISFWETALLAEKGRITIGDIHRWTTGILTSSGVTLIEPTPANMIDSVQLPPHHKDPFDRLLIAQALAHDLTLVTRDRLMQAYAVKQRWL